MRSRLSVAACALLASSGAAANTRAETTPLATPTMRFEGAALIYGEQGRTSVFEPNARFTRLFAGGQTVSAALTFDAITGASPTGAMPSGTMQTTTSPSGRQVSISQEQVPTSQFSDARLASDLEASTPIGRVLALTLGGHISREKDYQSLGASAKASLDLWQHTTTLTFGGGSNHDAIFPRAMIHRGLSSGSDTLGGGRGVKNISSGLFGLSQILSRRWMAAATATRTVENGYLTDPYKVVSVLNRTSGATAGTVTEKRPSRRTRSDVLLSSVYHFDADVLYSESRFYGDDWGLRSLVVDFKYRHELKNGTWFEPHVRMYGQSKADFFRYGLPQGDPLPEYATSDSRLGRLASLTLGATYGFRIPQSPGEWSLRGELISQTGNSFPAEAIGAQRNYDLAPPLTIGSLVATYAIEF